MQSYKITFIFIILTLLLMGAFGCTDNYFFSRKKETEDIDQSQSNKDSNPNIVKKSIDPNDPLALSKKLAQKNLPPEKAKEVLSEVGDGWLYGQGFGATALNLGTIIVFPPYALYVLGNVALSMTGHETMSPTKLLPDDNKKEVDKFYDNLTSAPGRVAAAFAGKEFRTQDSISERIDDITKDSELDKKSLKTRHDNAS